MAFPQKVSDQLARAPSHTPGFSGQLFMLTGLFFLLSLGSYFGLKYGYLTYLNNEVENLDQRIGDFTKEIPPEKQIEITNLYSQLANLETVLKNRTKTSAFLAWLESHTQINVYYQTFRFDALKREVLLNGVAKSIDDVGEQIIALNSLEEVTGIEVRSISVGAAGGWQFDLKLNFKPGFLTEVGNKEINP